MIKNLLKNFNKSEQEFQSKPTSCFNCNRLFDNLESVFCTDCGQKRTFSKLKFGTLLKDFLEDYLLFDGKIFKSLKFLFFQPGQLTHFFNNGQRVRFIAPIRLFLFSGVLCFFILSWNVNSSDWKRQVKLGENGTSINFEAEADSTVNERTHWATIQLADTTIDVTKIGRLILKMENMTEKQAIDSLEILVAEHKSPEDFEKFGINLIEQLVKLVQSKGERLFNYFINQLSLVVLFLQPIVAF